MKGRLTDLLSALDGAIAAIEANMGEAWPDTVVALVSEFGRTAYINGNDGTDHGTATVVLLAGGALKGRRVIADWPGLKSPYLQPAIRCGQHSLEIFCLGVFLAFAGQFIISEWSGGPLIQMLISLVGILIMVAIASLISWYKQMEGRSSTGRSKSPDADLAGGEA